MDILCGSPSNAPRAPVNGKHMPIEEPALVPSREEDNGACNLLGFGDPPGRVARVGLFLPLGPVFLKPRNHGRVGGGRRAHVDADVVSRVLHGSRLHGVVDYVDV